MIVIRIFIHVIYNIHWFDPIRRACKLAPTPKEPPPLFNFGRCPTTLLFTAADFIVRIRPQFSWRTSLQEMGREVRKVITWRGRGSSLILLRLLTPKYFLIDIRHICCRLHTLPVEDIRIWEKVYNSNYVHVCISVYGKTSK